MDEKNILKKWRDANLECHRLRSISIRPRQRVNIHRKIVDLTRFYLSNINLVLDSTVRNFLSKDGSILLSALLLKPKMSRVASGDWHLISEALRENENDKFGIFRGQLRSNPARDNVKADFILSKDQRRVKRVREYNDQAALLGAAAASASAAIQSSRYARDVTRKARKYISACAANSASLCAFRARIDAHRAAKAAKVAFSAALAVAKNKLSKEDELMIPIDNDSSSSSSSSSSRGRSSILGRRTRKTRLESMANRIMISSSDEEEEEEEVKKEDKEEENDDNKKVIIEDETSLKQYSERFGGLPRATERYLNTLRRSVTQRSKDGALLYKGESLHSASLKADKYRVQALLHLGADPNRRDEHDMTPLHHAVDGRSLYVTALLLLQNANLGNVDKWKSTPLHYAVENRDMGMVRLLVNAGAPLSIVSIHGQTPIDLAIDRNFQDIADWIILNKPPADDTVSSSSERKRKGYEKKRVGSLLVGTFRRSSMQEDPELARVIREKTELEVFEDEVRSNVQLASQTKTQTIRTRKKSLLIGDLAMLHRRGFSMYI